MLLGLAMVSNLINQNKEILEAVDDLKKKQNAPMTYARRVVGAGGGQPQGGAAGGQKTHPGQSRGRESVHDNLQVPRHNRERSNSSKRPRISSEHEQEDVEVNPRSDPQQPPWSDGQGRRKLRSNGAKVVRGTAGVAAGHPGGGGQARQGWRAAPRDIFVYHTHHSTTIDDIKDLVNETSKVEVLEVEKRSREGSYFGSFRVKVNRDEFDIAMQPEHWPAGWSVREYFIARQKPGGRPADEGRAQSNSSQKS
jgi:hypothetical protein